MIRIIGIGLILLHLPGLLFAKEISFNLSTGKPGQKVVLGSDLFDWDFYLNMDESSPGKYSITIPEPWLHTLKYKFQVDGQWIEDPLNPNKVSDGYGGYNSLIQIEGFKEDPLLVEKPGHVRWERSELNLKDWEGAERKIIVYHPPAEMDSTRSVTVYFQDGQDYIDRAGAANLLANLSDDENMPLITGVFIPPKDRMREYKMLPEYSQFLAQVVVPAVEEQFNTGGAKDSRLLIGPSLGGLITLYTGLLFPETFGLLASQSGSLWWEDGKVLSMFGDQRSSNPRIFLEVGIYENPEKMLGVHRQAVEVLNNTDIPYQYQEYPSTHDWMGWRNRLTRIFRSFFSKI